MLKTLCLLAVLQSSNPDSVLFIDSNVAIDSAYQLRLDDKAAEAVMLLDLINEEDSNYYEAQADALSILNDSDRPDETIQRSKKLILQPNEKMDEIYLLYGNAYLKKGALDSAKSVYDKGLDLYPYHHVFLYNKGIVFYRQNELDEAEKWFKQALLINPFYSSAHLMLGHISILKGHRTKGLMSYMVYLFLDEDANSALVTIDNLTNDAIRYEGSNLAGGNVFEQYDNLLKSRAAFDDRFKYKTQFNAPIVKQFELLSSKLKPQSGDDFWEVYYLPLFLKIKDNNLAETTLYYILTSTGKEEVLEWLEKNSKLTDQWLDIVNGELYRWRDKHEAMVLGEKNLYDFWYYDNNDINAIGNENAAEDKVGSWVFFYDNGQTSAIGKYNEEGYKIGDWKYYFENGRLSREEYYDDNGDVSAPFIYYREDGSKATEVPYKDNDVEGIVKYYNSFNHVREETTYAKGQAEGKGQTFYKSGAKNIEYQMSEGKLNGAYMLYHETGSTKGVYQFDQGNKTGEYQIFYSNGQLEESSVYVDDVLNGACIGYFSDGNISYEGQFAEGEKVGHWKYYYRNGKISYEEFYNDSGELEGERNNFSLNGFQTVKEVFKEDMLVEYAYYDSVGNVLSSASDPSGNMEFKKMRWTGEVHGLGTLKNGKLSGEYTLYHRNGAIYQKGTKVEGLWEGPFEEYYSNGQLAVAMNYSGGSRDGHYTYYDKLGNKLTEGYYIDDEAQQWWVYYYQDGTVDQKVYYIDDEYQGRYITNAANGKLWSQHRYKENAVVEYVLYDSSGQELQHKIMDDATGLYSYQYPNGNNSFASEVVSGAYVSSKRHFYPDGKLMSEAEIINGVYHGKYTNYGHNGNVLIEGSYQNDLKKGKWKYYSVNGELEREYDYMDGELHGALIVYYANGNIESKGSYYFGERHGPSYYYDDLGNLQLIKYYDREIGFYAYQYEDKNGQLTPLKPYTMDMKKIEAYFPNGQLSVVQEFDNGFFNGSNKYFNIKGQLLEQTHLKDGDYNGELIQYYANGQVRRRANYVNDELMGLDQSFYPNGQLKESSEMIFGEMNGEYKAYDQNGKVIEKWFYWNDFIYE